MFLDSINEIVDCAKKTNFTIFAVDSFKAKTILKKEYKSNVQFLEPDETNKISVDMIRDFVSGTSVVDTRDRFFVVLNAETMNVPAENAFLKNLEEPKPHHHFILVTLAPSALLSTVVSRAQVFYLKEKDTLSKPIESNEKVKELAKRLLVSNAPELIALADEIYKKKDNQRLYAQEIVGTAIEISYKSYFATSQPKFIKKLPNLLKLYDNIQKNGNVRLHIVADMI